MTTKLGMSPLVDNRVDLRISIALMVPSAILMIQYVLLIVFDISGTNIGSTIQLLSKVIVGIVYVMCLPSVLKRNAKCLLLVYAIAIFVFLLQYAIFPENRVYMSNLVFPLFFMCLPSLVYVLSLTDLKILLEIMRLTGYVVFMAGLVLGLLVFSGRASIGAYSMSLSYYLLLPAVIFLKEFFDRLSVRALLISLISIVIILALGSRGAMLCILVFLCSQLVRPRYGMTLLGSLFYVATVGVGLVSLIYLNQIMTYMYGAALQLGINSRTLSLYFREGVHLSGREVIFSSVMAEIAQNPILGIGMSGDRRVLGGTYVHNVLVEIIGSFGYIIGGVLVVWILTLVIRSLLTRDRLTYHMTVIWTCMGFVPLMVSGSYLTDVHFWIFIGLLISHKAREDNRQFAA